MLRRVHTDNVHYILDEHDAIVPVQQDAARPSKRLRKAPRRPTLVTLAGSEDAALTRKILQHLPPGDLFALSFTCRTIRSFLRSASAGMIWRRSRKNVVGPAPPPCPKSMSEIEWTALLYQKKCGHCWRKALKDVDWGLRRRFCAECQKQHVKSQVRLPNQYKDVSEDVFRLLPYSLVARKGKKSRYFWEPEVDLVHSTLKAFDQRVRAGDRPAIQERASYIAERKRYVTEVLDAVPACEKWHQSLNEDLKARQDKAKADLLERSLGTFTSLGYTLEDVNDVLKDEQISQLAGIGKAWQTFFNKVRMKLDQRVGPLASRVSMLRGEYRSFLKTYVPSSWETLVPFGDIISIPDVRARLRETPPDRIMRFAKDIPSMIDAWREDVEAELLATLPVSARPVRKADAPSHLTLASSVWRRGDDPAPLTYPHMLLVSHLLSLEFGELKYSTREGPWSAHRLQYDAVGAGVARTFCKFVRLDSSTATATRLDESTVRLQCKLCEDVWPLVLNWRQAIQHLHETHPERASGSWTPFPSWIQPRIELLEVEAEIWLCKSCPTRRKLRSVVEVKRHLADKHSIARPTKGKDYAKLLALPLSDPVNVLQLYADCEDEDSSYTCRQCDNSANLPEMLQHLETSHAANLQPLARIPPPAVPAVSRFGPSIAGTQVPSLVEEPLQHDAETDALGLAGDVHAPMEVDVHVAQLKEEPVSPPPLAEASLPDPVRPGEYLEEIPNTAEPYLCACCPRAVDRLRRYEPNSMRAHLAMRHYIVSPKLDRDYSVAEVVDPDEVVPWRHGAIYTCARCPDVRDRFSWDDIDYHLVIAHQVADPVASRDYSCVATQHEAAEHVQASDPGPDTHIPMSSTPEEMDQATDDASAQNSSLDRNAKRSSSRRDSLRLQQARLELCFKVSADVSSSTRAPMPPWNTFEGFVCVRCPEGTSWTYRLHPLLDHLANCHDIRQPSLEADYDLVTRRWGAARETAEREATFFCVACGPYSHLYREVDVREHCMDEHDIPQSRLREPIDYVEVGSSRAHSGRRQNSSSLYRFAPTL